MEVECQARALYAQSPSEGPTHPHLSDLGLLLYSGVYLIMFPSLSLGFPNLGAIGCLLELHAPQRLLIIRVIGGGGLKICLSTQVNPGILESMGKEAAIGSTRVELST